MDYIEIDTPSVNDFNAQHNTTFIACAFTFNGAYKEGVADTPESRAAFPNKPILTADPVTDPLHMDI